MKKIFTTLAFAGMLANSYSQTCTPWSDPNGIWQGKGRIAISSDGNEHDHDDWPATPFSLALLAAKGLQNSLTLYTYSDHIWGSNHDHSDARSQMNTSALEGKTQFGFTNTNFFEAVSDPNKAYDLMRDEILKSTAANPLIIIAAGPMQVVGSALDRAAKHAQYTNQLNYVTIISHSLWNDKHADKPDSWENHSGWTWDEMKSSFSTGVKKAIFIHIVDQNGGTGYDGMQAVISKFDWVKNSASKNNVLYKAGSWDWLYKRLETCKKDGGKNFDPSDAGMIIYLLTGKEKTDPSDAKAIMESPVAPCGGGGSTDPGTPTDISNLVATSVSCTSVKLTWSDVSGETGYRVRRKLSTETTYTNLADVAANAVTYTDNTAVASKTYDYVVRPLVNGVATNTSNIQRLTTPSCVKSAELSAEVGEHEIISGISPNPAVDKVTINIADLIGSATIEIRNLQGAIISSITTENKSETIDVSNLVSGVYMITVHASGKSQVEKLIVK